MRPGWKELFLQDLQVFEGQLHLTENRQDAEWKTADWLCGYRPAATVFHHIETDRSRAGRELSFADHQSYSEADLSRLHQEALHAGAELVTTHMTGSACLLNGGRVYWPCLFRSGFREQIKQGL